MPTKNKDDKITKGMQKKNAGMPESQIERDIAQRRRESDLPGALSAVGIDEEQIRPTLSEAKCNPVGERKDRTLGCALALIHADSQASFLASVGNSSSF